MRIVHVIDSAGLYGAEAVLLELGEGLSRRGHDCIVASIATPGCEEKPVEVAARERGLRVSRVAMLPGPNPAGALRLLKLAWREQADVVHSHGYKGNILLGLVPRRMRRVPLVVTLHGYTHAAGFSRMSLYMCADRLALRGADRVVLVHRGMTARKALDHLDRPDWRVIENGVPRRGSTGAGGPLDERVVRFYGDEPVIGAVGRLSPEKGLRRLIEALGILALQGRPVRGIVLGEGPQRAVLERSIAAAGLSGKVLLPGHVANARDHLALFDVFVLPSLTEGLPITLLEAMQARLPIVATRVGGVPGVLEDGRGGVLVDPDDAEQLASAILRVLDDRDLAGRLAAFAAARVESHFSSETMVERYVELYREIAA